MSKKTAIGQTPNVQQEDTTIQQPISMYEASKEFYRVEKRTIVAAHYVRNSDPSKKDSEVLKAQADALLEYGKNKGYECPDHLLYVDAISALKYPYWERPGLMKVWDDAERGEFDVVLCTEFIRVARVARKSSEQHAVMEYRDRARGEAAQAEIKTKSGNAAVDLLLADLSAQQSIRQLVENFQQRYTQLHVLINNAGPFMLRRHSKKLDNKTEEQ